MHVQKSADEYLAMLREQGFAFGDAQASLPVPVVEPLGGFRPAGTLGHQITRPLPASARKRWSTSLRASRWPRRHEHVPQCARRGLRARRRQNPRGRALFAGDDDLRIAAGWAAPTVTRCWRRGLTLPAVAR